MNQSNYQIGYEGKLKELGLMSLEGRRERADLIETFKILRGIDNVNFRTWFTKVEIDAEGVQTRSATRQLNLVHKNARTDVRKNFFSNRVVNKWNSLPANIKDSKNASVFKERYDKYLNSVDQRTEA